MKFIPIRHFSIVLLTVFLTACQLASTSKGPGTMHSPEEITKRNLNLELDGKWIGNGISYGAYRDGEGPDKGSLTSKENILEDMEILAKRWNFIRIYDSSQQARNILEVIRDNKLPIRVMQGIWLSGHQTDAENQTQVDNAIVLANEFPEIIVAVNVGNEIFVDWSWHKVNDMETVIDWIRTIRSEIIQPVTVNDDYNFWNKPAAQILAKEIDFIGLHAYAFWNNKTLDQSLEWTTSTFDDIQALFPDMLIAYTETGWPTSRIYGDGSYEGGLIGKAGEVEQKTFFDLYNRWVEDNQIISLYFEAFDEQWKGGFDGADPLKKAEKNWGVYFSDRTPKLLFQ